MLRFGHVIFVPSVCQKTHNGRRLHSKLEKNEGGEGVQFGIGKGKFIDNVIVSRRRENNNLLRPTPEYCIATHLKGRGRFCTTVAFCSSISISRRSSVSIGTQNKHCSVHL